MEELEARLFLHDLASVASRPQYFDWVKIRFTEQFQPKISLARKDPAAIELGYSGAMEQVFTGFVTQPYNYGGSTDEIILKDEMLLLEDTNINNTFLDTTPQEVISYILTQAGVSKKKLSSQGFPIRKKLPIRQMSGVQAINAVNAAWNIKKQFFFSGGVFYWGEKPHQQKIYTFEYGVNIINLVRIGGVWELETVSAPFVGHSHKINVIHPKVSGEQGVIKVVSSTNDDGFIRTRIYFQGGETMLEEMMRAVAHKVIAQDYPYLKTSAVLYAVVTKAARLSETFSYDDLVIHNDETRTNYRGHIVAH